MCNLLDLLLHFKPRITVLVPLLVPFLAMLGVPFQVGVLPWECVLELPRVCTLPVSLIDHRGYWYLGALLPLQLHLEFQLGEPFLPSDDVHQDTVGHEIPW